MRKSVPPFTFSALCDLPETSKKNSKIIRNFFSQFLVFWELLLSPVVENVVFESFWALDMTPTWAVPGLFVVLEQCHLPWKNRSRLNRQNFRHKENMSQSIQEASWRPCQSCGKGRKTNLWGFEQLSMFVKRLTIKSFATRPNLK